MSQKLELISFKLCPFVQRAVIVLKNKNVDFDITYIDLNNPPAWFKEISPLGQVPVLKVGDDVLFESSVIQEYVDEVTPPSLHPADPLVKAKNRSWIAFGGQLNEILFKMIRAEDHEQFSQLKEQMHNLLTRLEEAHSGHNFFNSDDFCLIDAAFAPLFMRLNIISNACDVTFMDGLPKMQAWSQTLLERPCVKESVVEELPQLYAGMIQHTGGFLSTLA